MRDRLFLHFAIAFWLFALNELAVSVPRITSETLGYEYVLRVLGFVLILIAIADKNSRASISSKHSERHTPSICRLNRTLLFPWSTRSTDWSSK